MTLLRLPPVLAVHLGQDLVGNSVVTAGLVGQAPRGVETLSEEMKINIPENQSQSSYLELLCQPWADLLQVARYQRQEDLLVFHFLMTCSNFLSDV